MEKSVFLAHWRTSNYNIFTMLSSRGAKKAVIFSVIIVVLAGLALSQTDELKTRVFTIKGGRARDLSAALEHLKSAEGRITVYDASNSIIVVDHPSVLGQMEDIVRQLDVPRQQVEIRVLIVEASYRSLKEAGITPQTGIITPEMFENAEYLLERSEDSKVRSELTVRTISGEPAAIQAARNDFYGPTVTRTEGAVVYVPPQTRSAGNFLEVVPRVNSDGTINIVIKPKKSRFREDRNIYEQSIFTSAVLRSGETLVLGGVDTAEARTEQRGVPPVGISVATESSGTRKKMIMFLTATVVE